VGPGYAPRAADRRRGRAEARSRNRIIAGAAVATFTTLTNTLHPGKKADGYNDARLRLREEGWNLLMKDGDYRRLTSEPERFTHFVAAVRRIVKAKRANTNLEIRD
jgi:hypothetical protein